jgi:predicted CXXCH cytochrome family protein
MSRMRRIPLMLVALALIGLGLLGAKPLRPYRTVAGITGILAEGPHAGDCDQCHTMHGQGEVVYGHALQGPNENSLCDRCHETPWEGGSYGGTTLYLGSAHATNPGSIWPGPEPPPRTESGAAGKCLNCHDPHGWADATGPVPMLAVAREEALCLACHDGTPATRNIGADLAKPFRHPVSLHSGRHRGPLESQPADFAAAPADNRHAECVDCHDPHVAVRDRGGVSPAPALPRVNLGVSRLLVQNGAAGTRPTFVFVPGSDTLTVPIAEHQLCFKCHSSWTTQPTGQTDLALALNPANASYHPVEAAGRDATIDPGAFVPGWDASSLTRCSDCHGSDFVGSPRGPHGSSYRYILRGPYQASSQPRVMTSDESCFACHGYDVYANPAAAAAVRGASRFNQPGAGKGHAEHVGEQAVPCYACHVTHGSPDQPHLIVLGRTPGLTAFTETAGGGTCQSTCHAAQSYTVNYGR